MLLVFHLGCHQRVQFGGKRVLVTEAFNGVRQIGGALDVEVKLAIFTVVGKGSSGSVAGVAGEFVVFFVRRGWEEGKGMFGVRLVVDLLWQFDARLVEVEIAAWFCAAISRSKEVLLATGTEDTVFFLKVFGELQGVPSFGTEYGSGPLTTDSWAAISGNVLFSPPYEPSVGLLLATDENSSPGAGSVEALFVEKEFALPAGVEGGAWLRPESGNRSSGFQVLGVPGEGSGHGGG
ncbi:hypothetical protein Acr_08g0005230 [Actinidia rufa]|uniref:Uncharacterized protein n=1 Tax=Actinidia rufa TaxID=165716 RepID=A0A7J0F2K1_9ERIC|nr:hypothetical protein Acr_08g0005230 [Actinidia rufa]